MRSATRADQLLHGRRIDSTSRRRTPWSWLPTHLVSLVVALVAEWWLQRDLWFRLDDFDVLANRVVAHPSLSIWASHNEHWSTGPIVIWQLLYVWTGVDSSAPYFAVSLLAHVLTAHLLWRVMLRCGVHAGVATGLAASFAVLGAGWENITWAFQLGFIGSAALGLGAILLVVHGTRVRYLLGTALAVVSLTFSGISLGFVAAAGLALALRRQRLRAAALLGSCAAVYLTWYLLVGRDAVVPAHQAGRTARAAGAADWSWEVFAAAVGRYTSFVSAGSVLALALLVSLAVYARRHACTLRLATPTPARERFVVLSTVTASAVLEVASFAVNRDDISPPDVSRYLYFVIALLLPAFGLVLTAAARRGPRGVVALPVAYLVVTQAMTLVAQERTWTAADQQLRADTMGIAHLIAAGERVEDVRLSGNLTTHAIATWRDEGALADARRVPAQELADARAIAQVTAAPGRPARSGGATVAIPGRGQLTPGTCSTVTPEPGAEAATVELAPDRTVEVTMDDPGSLVYQVVDGPPTSRTITVSVPVHGSRSLTSTASLTVRILADSGQQETFCTP